MHIRLRNRYIPIGPERTYTPSYLLPPPPMPTPAHPQLPSPPLPPQNSLPLLCFVTQLILFFWGGGKALPAKFKPRERQQSRRPELETQLVPRFGPQHLKFSDN